MWPLSVIEVLRIHPHHIKHKPHNTLFMKNKNITRYTYENTDFQGWRVSIQRCGRIITRYFSDLYYGSEEESFREAVAYRDHVLSEMSLHRNDLPEYMDKELEHLQELLREKEQHPLHPHAGRLR